MSIEKSFFGTTKSGVKADIFTITNKNGAQLKVTNYGGTLVSIIVPGKNGKLNDVILGYDDLKSYENADFYFGALVGRHANRIKNAEFTLNGKLYKVTKNSGKHQLHGGFKGFNSKVWDAEIVNKSGKEALKLTYTSVDGEEGFPGTLNVSAVYSLTDDNAVEVDYNAVSDKDTIVNLTHHTYFNLGGHASGNIMNEKVMLNADKFTPIDKDIIPTGEIRDVEGTFMDFRKLTTVGDRIKHLKEDEQLTLANGFDQNWVIKRENGERLAKAAEMYDENTGIDMEVYTTMPGVQFYTGNFLNGSFPGKGGAIYNQRAGLCFEPQYFPNALECKNFEPPILKKGDEYNHTMIYKFSVK